MPKIPHIQVGDPITADFLNSIADKLEPAAKLTVAQGSHLEMMTSPFGKILSLRIPKEIPARLVGSSSPYSWVELTDGPNGTWTDRTAGQTGGANNAYEVNGKSGLGGKIVWLTWTSAGDWRFQYVGYAPPTVAWKFRINGCTTNTGVPGAVIELYQSGVLIDSCTTADGTGGTTAGECTMTVPIGSYDVVISGPTGAGFAGQSFTASAIAGTTTRNLTANADHVCIGSFCNYPFPKVLYTSDGLGTHTLTWNGTSWRGTYAYTTDVQFLNGGSCSAGTVMTVSYVFTGSTLSVNWRIVGCDCKYGSDNSFATVIPMCDIAASGSGTSLATFCSTHSGTYAVPTTGVLCPALDTCAPMAPGVQTPGGGGSMAVSP